MIEDYSMELYAGIESLVSKHNIGYLEAVVLYAENKGLEIEQISNAVKCHPKMCSSIQEEAENMHLLPKTSRLPI